MELFHICLLLTHMRSASIYIYSLPRTKGHKLSFNKINITAVRMANTIIILYSYSSVSQTGGCEIQLIFESTP